MSVICLVCIESVYEYLKIYEIKKMCGTHHYGFGTTVHCIAVRLVSEIVDRESLTRSMTQ